MRSSLASLLLLAALPPATGHRRLGWALVDQGPDGELYVQDKTITHTPGPGASFGDDLGDEFGDDYGDEAGDEAGDDYGDGAGDDDEDEAGGEKRNAKRRAHLERELAKLERHGRHGKKNVKLTDKAVSQIGAVATSLGQAMTMSLTPKSTFRLRRIAASGDTAALLTTVFAGEIPIVIDPIDTSLLAATAFHQPTFSGKMIHAGVPISVNYTAGSTTTALRLTFSGKGRAQSC